MTTIRIEGLDKLIGKLDRIGKLDVVKAGIKAGALHIKGKIAKYPPRRRIKIQQIGGWASDKQRRAFFAKLRSGEIQVPYKRGVSPGSETLGRKWTIQARDGGLSAVVGNNVSYGPFVQDRDRQSRMHKMIGWKTTQDVADEEGPKIRDIIAREVAKALNE